MRGDEQRGTVGDEFAQQCGDRRFGLLVDARERLVEKHNARALRNAAGDEGALLLPTRKLADLAIGEVGQVRALQGLIDGVLIATVRAACKAHVAVAAGHDDFAHGDWELPIHLFALRDVSDYLGLACGGGVRAVDLHCARIGFDQPHDRLEQGGFARAIHADEPAGAARGDGDAGLAQGLHVAVADGHAFDADRGRHEACPVRPSMMAEESCLIRSR